SLFAAPGDAAGAAPDIHHRPLALGNDPPAQPAVGGPALCLREFRTDLDSAHLSSGRMAAGGREWDVSLARSDGHRQSGPQYAGPLGRRVRTLPDDLLLSLHELGLSAPVGILRPVSDISRRPAGRSRNLEKCFHQTSPEVFVEVPAADGPQ